MGRYCVYLLAAGGWIAYAGSSGRMEERLRRHFGGYSSTAVRGLRPDAAYVLACTRSRSLVLTWETWLHKAHRPPHAARAPAERPRKPPHPPPGGTSPQRGLRAFPPAARQTPPPSPAAGAQAQCQDVGRGERRRTRCARGVRRICPRVLSRRIRVHRPTLPRRLGI